MQHNTDWEVWNDGVKRGVYVRDAGGQEPYIGQVRGAAQALSTLTRRHSAL